MAAVRALLQPRQRRGTSSSRTLLLGLLAAAALAATLAKADPFDVRTWSGLASSRPHPAVVRVIAADMNSMSLGSGTLVAVHGDQGLVVTNWHVVRDATGPVIVAFPDGFRSPATVLATDRDWDLAALAIWRPAVAPVAVAAAVPRPGDLLTIAGYGPGQYRAATGRCTQYVSPGNNLPYEMVELSVAARQGDSGGPIFNDRGELAGVLFGASFASTAGSYCGRVRWFLDSVSDRFNSLPPIPRSSSKGLLAGSPPLPSPPSLDPPGQPNTQVAQSPNQPKWRVPDAWRAAPKRSATPGDETASARAGTAQAVRPPVAAIAGGPARPAAKRASPGAQPLTPNPSPARGEGSSRGVRPLTHDRSHANGEGSSFGVQPFTPDPSLARGEGSAERGPVDPPAAHHSAPLSDVAETSEPGPPPDQPDAADGTALAAPPAAPAAAAAESGPSPTLAENVKTLLAGIGLFFILFHTLRLLSIAQGR